MEPIDFIKKYLPNFSSDLKLEPLLSKVQSPRSSRWLSFLMAGTLFTIVLCLIFIPWQQNVSGKGRVIAYAPFERQQQIQAPIEGRVVHWFVKEGSLIKQGEPLLELQDMDPQMVLHLATEQKAIEDRKVALTERKRALFEKAESLQKSRVAALASAEAKLQMAKKRVEMADQMLLAAKSNVSTARKNRGRQRALLEEGISSSRSRELADLEYDRAQAEVKRSQAFLSAAHSEYESFEAEKTRIQQETSAMIEDAKSALAQADGDLQTTEAELARISVRVSRQQSQVVKAPKDGTVFRVLINAGAEVVKIGTPLLLFVPDTVEKAAEMWVDGNDIPLISVGRSVRVHFEGWPAIQFVGWPSAAVGTFGGIVALVDSTDDGNGKFRVVVLPDPKDPWPESRYLRQGVRVNGWVLLNQVSLGFELWRQLNGFPPAVLPPQNDGPIKKE